MALTSPIRQRPRTTGRRELTWEDYLKLPLIKKRYDIVDGVLIMSPAPTSIHQYDLMELLMRMGAHVHERRLGVVLAAPCDVLIRKTPKLGTRQPDVLFLSAARAGIRGRKDLEKMPVIDVAPDLVVEILSPQEERRTEAGKLQDYASIGVLEVWIVSREAQTVEVLTLKQGSYQRAGIFGVGDMIRSSVLPDLVLNVDDVFED